MRRQLGLDDESWAQALNESDDLKELQLIEQAGITDPHLRMTASIMLAARRTMHALAVRLGKPLEEISREDIIAIFRTPPAQR
jgi:hypothetical protein